MTLPTSLLRWSPEALEEWKERASIVHEGCRGEESDWPAAKAAAERMVRARWAREPAEFLRLGVAGGRGGSRGRA